MTKRLAASFVDLVYNATLKSFWRRKALARFLRQVGVADKFLAAWSKDESKRDLLDRLFAKLPEVRDGQNVIMTIARDLAEQDTFPDLTGWEDSELKVNAAREAVGRLRAALQKVDAQILSDKERQAAQKRIRRLREEGRRARESLQSLDERLKVLATQLGSQQAGYAFQDWFYDLMDHHEVINRRPYCHAGRQIDGSITISGTTYLVELKFTRLQADVTDIDSFYNKVIRMADNTMGIMCSISGYSAVAIAQASGAKTPLLLLDHSHLYYDLSGAVGFAEIVDRVRRHASQTGESYLAIGALVG
jgi:hypothetical protein